MLAILEAIVLGIVEGITEWLPISSTGHMILFYELFNIDTSEAFWSMFLVVIQFGAILAVIVEFFKKLWPFHRKRPKAKGIYQYVSRPRLVLWEKIIVSCIPAAVIGLPLDDWLDEHLFNGITVAIMLILYGVLFIVVENRNKGRKPITNKLTEITWSQALIIGLFQCLALIPGTSRSGATILGGILIGLSRKTASEYTFFLAIPVMFGASLLKLIKFGSFTGGELGALLVGMVVAFFVSLLAIRFLMNYIRNHDFKVFGWYRIVLGVIVLICTAVGFF